MTVRTKKILLSITIVIVLGLFVYGGYYVYSIIKFSQNISDGESPLDEYEQTIREQNPEAYQPQEPPAWEGTERVNILLLGGDSRGMTKNDPPRSDTIMVASIDPGTKQAYLFSILRDTYTDIPGHYANRINAALALGSYKLAMETVSNLLGIDIQYYVFVDFEGFIKLVDALGGIEFEVEKNMYYYDPTDPEYKIDLKAGLQLLDGDKALQYVRFRYDRMGDYTRTERQRALLSALADKLTSTTSLLNLPGTLRKIEPYISTNIPANKMISLARLAYESMNREPVTAQLPPMHLLREETINHMEVITVNKNALQEYVQELFNTVNETSDATKENTDNGSTDGGASGSGTSGTNNVGTSGAGTGRSASSSGQRG